MVGGAKWEEKRDKADHYLSVLLWYNSQQQKTVMNFHARFD